MTAGWGTRTTRAAMFAAVCVLLAALGHVLMSGAHVPWWALAVGVAATGAVGWCLAGRERGLPLITSVVVEMRPVREVAAQYGVSQSWLFELLARYKAEGEAAFEPRSRRPRSSSTAIPAEAADLIIELREKLAATGLDAGPDTIAWHLKHHHSVVVSRATIARYLTKAGLVIP